ncbi:MAG TPA: M15 family metallopeptidase [Candidatus Saccharimonadales bacterium]|nr:M15 family metallopeptidase [Candidatus Saccharimonadales bacterium]
MKRNGLIVTAVAIVICVLLIIFFQLHHKNTPAATAQAKAKSNQAGQQTGRQPATTAPAGFDKNKYSTADKASLWVVVNKQHPLNPKTYAPDNLVVPNIPMRSNITSTEKYVRSDMGAALETMVKAAADAGIHLNLQSGYRSYSFQVTLYDGYVKQQGQTAADRQSARPGYSEHQTGLAADLGGTSLPSCNVADCFGATVEGKWLAANAYAYGFIIRYTTDKEATTGYEHEPWHIRYIGTELSTEMHAQGVETLEEFFGITGGTAY